MTREQPLKILFVVNYGSAKAAGDWKGIFVERQARSLRNLGVIVEPFDIGTSYTPVALFRSWCQLRREIRRFKPDLVHAQYGTVVAFISILSLHQTIITFSGSDLLRAASISPLRAYAGILISNIASLFARRVICVSGQLKAALWWREREAVVIPRGVDLDLFSPGPRDEARRALGWDPEAPIVLIDGGRDWKNKGLDIAQAAFAIARERIPKIELKIISNVPPEVMPVWYRAADALICSSRQEGSPNVVKEALACNLPIVGVDVGDIRERLADVRASAVVERTPAAIADALVRLIRNGGRSDGRTHVTALSLEQVARRIIDVYSNVIAPRQVIAITKAECP